MIITDSGRKQPSKAVVDEELNTVEVPEVTVSTKGVKKGNKQQISLTITPDLLEKVDVLARKMGQSRAAVINMAIYQAVESSE